MGTTHDDRSLETDREKQAPLLLVGYDGIEPNLVRRWAGEGRLPAFRRVFEMAASIPLESPWGLGSGAMWSSITTSRNPASNGMFFFRHLIPGTYRTATTDENQISGLQVWEAASQSGRRVVVLDVPKARLSRDLNGIMICDWLSHGEIYDQPVSHPPELIDKVIRRYGANPTGPCDITGRTPDEYEKFVKDMRRRVRMKTALTLDLMNSEDWQLFVTSYGESHCVGHHCWHLHDPTYVDYDPAVAARLGDPIFDIYADLDRSLSDILATLPEAATIMLLLGPGMGPNYNGERVLDDILVRLEGTATSSRHKNLDLLKTAWRQLPIGLRRKLSSLAEKVDEGSRELRRANHRFFTIPGNHSHAAIRINVKGREPKGIVSPGADYDTTCQELIDALGKVINLDTGKPIFTEFRRAVDSFHGPRADLLPDLMAEWDRTGPITRVASDRIGTIETQFREYRSGDHTMNCELFVRHPGTPAGRSNTAYATEDIGATIANLLGADFPGAEGKSIDIIVSDRL